MVINMPQIIFKGVTENTMKMLSGQMIPQLAKIIECPEDWITLELCPSIFFDKNGVTRHYPIVQVWWYNRPIEVEKEVTRLLSSMLLQAGYTTVQLSFHNFEEEHYYEIG